jgi:uncharacterized membrane protein
MTFSTPAALLLLFPAAAFVLWVAWPAVRAAGKARRPAGRRGATVASLVLRLLIVTLLVLSVAGAQWTRAGDDLSVIFLVDASDSMSPEQAAAAGQFVRQAVAAAGADDRAGVILFGRNALVEQPVQPLLGEEEWPAFASQPQRLQTDLAEAIRLSLALFPAGGARRLVVLSDGAATTGDTDQAAALAAASGVSVDTVYLPRAAMGEEIVVADVSAPSRAAQGETFRLRVTVDSTAATAATLRVLADGAVVYEAPVGLNAGSNTFVVPLQAQEPAFTRYQVQVQPDEAGTDSFPQNNQLSAFTTISGPPRVLLVAAAAGPDSPAPPDEAAQLRAALEASGLLVDQVTPGELPASVTGLAGYGSVVLVNVNAADLSPRAMEALRTTVRDLGGGLVVVGGPESYGMGGYFETPLEELLPVKMRIDDEERFPSVSLVLVMDRSGSMAAEEGGALKIQLAAEGAVRALGLLKAGDELTVIPVDEAADEVIGPLSATDREGAAARIRQIGAGGGGIFMRTGLEAAAEVIRGSDRPVRHIIVLADGADAEEKEGVPDLINSLTAEGVTVSMVSIGDGPDVPWLRQMAELGDGRFHLTDQAANLPQIFTQETAAIQRNYLVEGEFFPAQVSPSPLLTGIDETPPLYGYVATEPKPLAQVVLQSGQEDPLLATWQAGLGRTVAWTSDATGRWAVDWVPWAGFPRFWAQVVSSTLGRVDDSLLTVSVAADDDRARVTVDAQDEAGAFMTGLELTANVVDPAGATTTVALSPVAPGRYEGTFEPAAEGAYFVGVGPQEGAGDAAGRPELRQTAGWVLGYSPEYQATTGNPALLERVAAAGGGRSLSPDPADPLGPAAAFTHDLESRPTSRPLWPWLTLLAALLLPFDVAARRLVVSRGDLARGWERLTRRPAAETAPATGRSEAMGQLFEAKERATTRRPQSPPQPVEPAGPAARPVAPPPPAAPTPTEAERTAEPSAEEGETLAARLRKRRG